MDNDLKNAVNNIVIKSDAEDRIIAGCKAKLINNTKEEKTVSRIKWQKIITAAVCCAVILCSLIILPKLANKKIAVKPADESVTYTKENTKPAASSVSIETQSNVAVQTVPKETESINTKPSAATTKNVTQPTNNKPSIKTSIRALGDFIPMTLDELEVYYGRKIIPASLPKDLVLQKNDDTGICKRNDKTPDYDDLQSTFYKGLIKEGDIFFDDNTITFRSPVNDRALTIIVAKDRYPTNSIGDPVRFSKITVSGVEARIAHYNDAPYSNSDMYDALVMVDATGYYLFSNNLTKNEFMSVLTAIIK